MKKTYSKPEIMFESFTLCTSIAAGCEIIIDTQSSGTCGYAAEGLGGRTMFTSDYVAACDVIVDDDGAKNGFCYHVPIETNNLFNS